MLQNLCQSRNGELNVTEATTRHKKGLYFCPLLCSHLRRFRFFSRFTRAAFSTSNPQQVSCSKKLNCAYSNQLLLPRDYFFQNWKPLWSLPLHLISFMSRKQRTIITGLKCSSVRSLHHVNDMLNNTAASASTWKVSSFCFTTPNPSIFILNCVVVAAWEEKSTISDWWFPLRENFFGVCEKYASDIRK